MNDWIHGNRNLDKYLPVLRLADKLIRFSRSWVRGQGHLEVTVEIFRTPQISFLNCGNDLDWKLHKYSQILSQGTNWGPIFETS